MKLTLNIVLESGNTVKAVNAAIRSKEWNKALEILKIIDNNNESVELYMRIAQHYEGEAQYEMAERLYLDAERPSEAIEMYNRASRWVESYKLASEFFGLDESRELYLQKAKTLEQNSHYKEAEEVYL